jgi:hypothetical protein
VNALVNVSSGPDPGLWIGGEFQIAGAIQSHYVARWSNASPIGDINKDGDVDGIDLAALLAAWGTCPTRSECIADLDEDGAVDGFDLALLLSAWG